MDNRNNPNRDESNKDQRPSSGLEDLLTLLRDGVREPMQALAGSLDELSRSAEVRLLRQALRSGRIAAGLPPREVGESLDQLKRLADRLRREGLDPAIGVVNLVGDCLDGLEALLAVDAVTLPPELLEIRLALARQRRPETRLELTLPAERARAVVAGQIVRALAEGEPDLAETETSLTDLEAAVAAAAAGAIERERGFDPRQPIELRASLRADLLSVEIADHVTGEGPAIDLSEAEWNLPLIRRVMDHVSFERGEAGARLRLQRRLRLWQMR